jgi:dolichyl-phosphate beta-glucosyltransferase
MSAPLGVTLGNGPGPTRSSKSCGLTQFARTPSWTLAAVVGPMQKTKIVIPCYNEASRLPTAVLGSYLDSHPHVHFVLVDDGSTDGTFDVLTRFAAVRPESASVLRLSRNSGKGEAVREGMLAALDAGADFVGYWDADLATPLHYIDVFVEQMNKSDAVVVFGSRVRLLGRQIERNPVRHHIGRGFATLAALALRVPVYDTQCGAKLFRASAGIRGVLQKPFELRWLFDVELFARLLGLAQRSGKLDCARQFVEWPLHEWRDAPGSKLKASHFPRIVWGLPRLFVIARREARRS